MTFIFDNMRLQSFKIRVINQENSTSQINPGIESVVMLHPLRGRGPIFLFTLLFSLLWGGGRGWAQIFVTIPDSNFASYLQTAIPAAMNGNQMDITHPLVTTGTTSINVAGDSISNLEGIQHFSSLVILNCANNNLGSLPDLSYTLQYLYCDNNALTSLPAVLPESLVALTCSFNAISAFPVLPDSLTLLNCSNNQLIELPAFPAALSALYCSKNQLTDIPDLPGTVSYVDCSFNQLTNLPALPGALSYLNCSHNLLGALPTLPAMLSFINCSHNKIGILPALPDSLKNSFDCSYNNLTLFPTLLPPINALNCSHNQITALPLFPASLVSLDCSYNNLGTLPQFSAQMQELICSHNAISAIDSFAGTLSVLLCDSNSIACFPVFPDSVSLFDISGNPFNCVPNYINSMDSAFRAAVPICGFNNPNGCDDATVIASLPPARGEFGVFPNPSEGMLFLRTDGIKEAEIEFYGPAGNIVHRIQNLTSEFIVDLRTYPSGIYYVRLLSPVKTISKKVMIQNGY